LSDSPEWKAHYYAGLCLSQVRITLLYMMRAGLFKPIRILPWQTKNVFHNITRFAVLCERLGRMIIFRSLWRKNFRPQHPLVKSNVNAYFMCFVALFQKLSFLVSSITTHKQYSLKNMYIHVAHILW